MSHTCSKCHDPFVCSACGKHLAKSGIRRSPGSDGEIVEKQQWHCDKCNKTTVNPQCKCGVKEETHGYWPDKCKKCGQSFIYCPTCGKADMVRDGTQTWVTADQTIHGRSRWRCKCGKITIKPICACEEKEDK